MSSAQPLKLVSKPKQATGGAVASTTTTTTTTAAVKPRQLAFKPVAVAESKPVVKQPIKSVAVVEPKAFKQAVKPVKPVVESTEVSEGSVGDSPTAVPAKKRTRHVTIVNIPLHGPYAFEGNFIVKGEHDEWMDTKALQSRVIGEMGEGFDPDTLCWDRMTYSRFANRENWVMCTINAKKPRKTKEEAGA
jgi:hypothetical protein